MATINTNELAGTWLFQDYFYYAYVSAKGTYDVNFNCVGVNYSRLKIEDGGYDDDDNMRPNIYYDDTKVYGFPSGSDYASWVGDYRTVTITSLLDDVENGDILLEFMNEFATKQSDLEPETPTDTVTIEYNGSVIASLKAGQRATLPCKDKPMHTDVVVSVPEGLGGSVEEWDGSYTISGGEEEPTASTLTLNNIGAYPMYYAVDANATENENMLLDGESVVLTGINSFVSCVTSIDFLENESTFTDCEVEWDTNPGYGGSCRLYPKSENATANLYAYD